MTVDACTTCDHDWHGLPCSSRTTVRRGWTLATQACDCAGALAAAAEQSAVA